MEIKTLAEILAETNQATTTQHDANPKLTVKPTYKRKTYTFNQNKSQKKSNKSAKPYRNKQTKSKKSSISKRLMVDGKSTNSGTDGSQTSETVDVTIKSLLQQIKDDSLSESQKYSHRQNLQDSLQKGLKTEAERQKEKEQLKADSRLRWLAFYYLSRREHSAKELKQKLLAKNLESDKIDELLQEFSEKGYQSDTRTSFMLIREGIRKKRGRRRIKQEFLQKKLPLPSNIDELIDLANEESDEFIDVVSNDTNKKQRVDWLQLAVAARVKKYGCDIPNDAKQKAKQLRFLQYRGFNSDVCFEALKHNLSTLDEANYE